MKTNTKVFTGKVALVTGGSRGIGAAIARRLAAEGADVAISYAASAEKAQAIVEELKAKATFDFGVKFMALHAPRGCCGKVTGSGDGGIQCKEQRPDCGMVDRPQRRICSLRRNN